MSKTLYLQIDVAKVKGHGPSTTLKVDGLEVKKFGYEVSRRLTNTTGEAGDGIFEPSRTSFYRGKLSVDVTFTAGYVSPYDDPIQCFEMIEARVQQVLKAFDEAQPITGNEQYSLALPDLS